ncbi:MAG: alpha/beta hydrolase [Novosphingobium sp.]|nr:alpha/beta hydrolase [Novosphingobium sp.]
MTRVTLPTCIELDVLDCGPRDAPALVFLHGFPESHRTWRHQTAHFSDRFRCIAPDQRGYRGSSKPQDVASYTIDRLVADIFQMADALEVERFTIVGHDWGGAIAWGIALMGQRSRVTGAIICNAPHPAIFQKLQWTDPAQRGSSQYFTVFRDTSHDDAVRDKGLTGMLSEAFPVEGLFRGMESQEQARLLEEWCDPEAAFGMLNWYRASTVEVPAMDAPFGLTEGRTLPDLPRLTIPTLVIWALDDLALPNSNLDDLPESIDDLTITRVPDCGHFAPWQAPDKVNAAMEEFLGR